MSRDSGEESGAIDHSLGLRWINGVYKFTEKMLDRKFEVLSFMRIYRIVLNLEFTSRPIKVTGIL